MRLLLIHADHFEYETLGKAVKEPEPLQELSRRGGLENGLVVFCTVEKPDEAEPEKVAENAASSIEEVLGWLKTHKVMIYPYAHLSGPGGTLGGERLRSEKEPVWLVQEFYNLGQRPSVI